MAVKFGYKMPLSAIMAGISANKKAGETVQDRWHKLAVSTLAHLHEHGDWDTGLRLANDIVEGLGNGARRNTMREWFERGGDKTTNEGKGPFIYNTESKLLVRNFNFPHRDIGVNVAITNPWYDFTAEKDYVPLDFAKALSALIKKAEKDIEKMGDASKVDRTILARLKGDTTVNAQAAQNPGPTTGNVVDMEDAA